MDATLMSLRAMAETAASVGVGVSVVGGAAIWLFREKIAKWVRSVMAPQMLEAKTRIERMEGRVSQVEVAVGENDTAVQLIAKSIEEMTKGFERVTRTLERVDERAEETALVVARIEGTMERRGDRSK